MAQVALVGAALAVVPSTAEAWHPHVHAASAYAQRRAGQVTFAVRTPHRLYGRGVTRVVPSASVLKAMLLVAYLRRDSVRHRALTRADRRLLGPMIRRSDNASAGAVRNIVGNAGLRRLAHRAGMRRFTPVASPWGLSRIDAADQTRFFLKIDRLTPRRHRRTALRLLSSIVRLQRWGIGRERPRGWALYFKGRLGLRHRLGGPSGRAAAPRPAPAVGRDSHHEQPEPHLRQADPPRGGRAAPARPPPVERAALGR